MRKAKVGIFDGNKNPRARAVICITTGKIFNTAKEAAEFYGFSKSSISVCCTGKRKYGGIDIVTGYKLEWMFYDEWINTSYKERKEELNVGI